MGEPFDVQSAEAQAAREMQRRIGSHLSYADSVYRLLDLAISHYGECETRVGSVDYVALLLMGRMANDMRAIGALARLSYGVQARALAASVFEVAFTLSTSSLLTNGPLPAEKAAAWSSHADPRHSFMSTRQGVRKFVDRMRWSEDEKRTAKYRWEADLADIRNKVVHGALSGFEPDTGHCTFVRLDLADRGRVHEANAVTTTLLDLCGALVETQALTRRAMALEDGIMDAFVRK